MAIACLRLVTFFPERPLLSFPCFISFMARSTFLPLALLYLRAKFYLPFHRPRHLATAAFVRRPCLR
jgi:hypothetical protein